ncbi:MAG: biotin transporter BioY [Ignavibacteriales bacterium]|nr:biotin transporter BioY [Ignavibacteriales bacterium]
MSQGNASVLSAHWGIRSDYALAQVFWIAFFAATTALAAQIEIPHQPVPFTLQTFSVLLAGARLGRSKGVMSMGMYLLLGVLGFPVFSGAGAGLLRIAGPTGGYLLGFPIAAFAVGSLLYLRHDLWWTAAVMTLGLLIIFSVGTIQLNLILFHDWTESIKAGFLVFSWWDAAKLCAATAIAHYYRTRVR